MSDNEEAEDYNSEQSLIDAERMFVSALSGGGDDGGPANIRGFIERAMNEVLNVRQANQRDGNPSVYDIDRAQELLAGFFRYDEEDDEDYVPNPDFDDDDDVSMEDYFEEELIYDLEGHRGGIGGGAVSRYAGKAAVVACKGSKLERVPNKQVTTLLDKGEFGYMAPRSTRVLSELVYPQTTSHWLLHRQLGMPTAPHSELTKRFLPNNVGRVVKLYQAPAYGGQFSHDGKFFYAYTQDFKVYLYDTRDPARPKLVKIFETAMGTQLPLTSRWTVTDADMSRDNRLVVHSTRSPLISLSNVASEDESSTRGIELDRRSVVYCVKFSSDGRELLIGNSKPTVDIYDLQYKKCSSTAKIHEKDINSARYLDDSNNVVISGSDDSTIRIWDRRTWGLRCSGVLPGHLEGVTCVETKGDGRYILSNGKDQTMKLWDIRKCYENNKRQVGKYHGTGFRYQFDTYTGPRLERHPLDASVMTYRAHEVLLTAIRCHFSPAFSTDQQFVYSGSSDGDVYIWKLDGTLVRQLEGDETKRAHESYSRLYDINRDDLRAAEDDFRICCIRDVSWHPTMPYLYAPALADFESGTGNDCGALMIYSYNHESDPGAMESYETEFEYRRTRVSSRLATINKDFSAH
jgi:WD repeat-containing protein 23